MNRYQVFVKVVETGSFTRTAEALGYTQSAVSQNVAALENELSATLLHRTKSGVGLTADGREYFPYIQALCAAHQRLEEKHREMEGLENGVIRMGTFTSVSRSLLPHCMKEFQRKYPRVRFELEQGEYTSIGQWLRQGSVDLGFLTPETASGLESATLCEDEMLALLPAGHPLARQEKVSAAQLAAQPFILLGEGEYSVPMRVFRSQGLEPDVRYRVIDDYTIMAMVEEGLGVSALYRRVLGRLGPGLRALPIEPPMKRTIVLACRDRKTLPLASRYFMDFLLGRLKQEEGPGKVCYNTEKTMEETEKRKC